MPGSFAGAVVGFEGGGWVEARGCRRGKIRWITMFLRCAQGRVGLTGGSVRKAAFRPWRGWRWNLRATALGTAENCRGGVPSCSAERFRRSLPGPRRGPYHATDRVCPVGRIGEINPRLRGPALATGYARTDVQCPDRQGRILKCEWKNHDVVGDAVTVPGENLLSSPQDGRSIEPNTSRR